MAKKNNLNKKGGTGELKTYDNSFLANLGRLKGKFREKVPESWRTILPGVSDIEDVAYLLDSYGPNGTILDKAISSAALALPIASSKAVKEGLSQVPKFFKKANQVSKRAKNYVLILLSFFGSNVFKFTLFAKKFLYKKIGKV